MFLVTKLYKFEFSFYILYYYFKLTRIMNKIVNNAFFLRNSIINNEVEL